MIRPFTFLCMVGALGSGLYLYQCKHQAQVLDREIARTIKQTDGTRERIGLLRAEWTQLNQPDRVSDLARAHTSLQTARPNQFITANELSAKLPAAVAPSQAVAPSLPPTDLPETAPVAQAEPPRTAAAPVAVAASTPHAPAARAAAPETRTAEARPTDPKTPETRTQDGRTADAHPADPHRNDPKPTRVAHTTSPVVAQAARPETHSTSSTPQPASASLAANDPVAPGTIGASVLRTMRAREAIPALAYVQPVATPAAIPPTYRQSAYTPPAYVAPANAPAAAQASAPGAAQANASVLGARGALPPPVPFAAR